MLPVTLACIDCVDPELAVLAMQTGDSMPFAKRILLSHECPQNLSENIEFRKIDRLDTLKEYSRFMLQKFWTHIETPHVLTVQSDGYILRPDLWNNDWLKYDYIGAPWPQEKIWAKKTQVGNSGLCLRSRAFLLMVARIFDHRDMDLKEVSGYYEWSDDIFPCYLAYDSLVDCGIKFGPISVAADFAYEDNCNNVTQSIDRVFGFHGRLCAETNRLCESLRTKISGRKLRLIVNYYNDPYYPRSIELDECFRSNCGSGLFDDVIILASSETHTPSYRRVHRVWSQARPTFADHIGWANRCTRPNDINVIANLDIQFEQENIPLFWRLRPKEFWALSRWENSASPVVPPREYKWCQDTWAWRGECRIDLKKADFPFGYPGCENRIAYLAHEAGYQVCNPSFSVKTIHVHDSGFRRYPATDAEVKCKDRIKSPYLYVPPHDIIGISHPEIDEKGPDLPEKKV